MSATKPSIVLPFAVACAALCALGACGGGGDSSAPPVTTSPTAPVDPTPPAQPTQPAQPSQPSQPTQPTQPTQPQPTQPQPTPPVDPAPPVSITLATGYTAIRDTVTFSQAHWPAWSHTGSAPIDGIVCGPKVVYHIHALLSIYKDGQRLALPGNIGRPNPCDYEMHTHDGSGVLHIETDSPKVFTLGQFFAEWGQPIGATSIAGLLGTPTYYVIDKEQITRFTGDPSTIDLVKFREILVVTGTAPAQVPRYDWNNSGL